VVFLSTSQSQVKVQPLSLLHLVLAGSARISLVLSGRNGLLLSYLLLESLLNIVEIGGGDIEAVLVKG
jgi:hypothetical protein